MSDWQVGDLAVCVDASAWPASEDAPSLLRAGAIYRVIAYWPDAEWRHVPPSPGLQLEGVKRPKLHSFFSCERFRKIRPDKHEECEPEFVQLLKRSKVSA